MEIFEKQKESSTCESCGENFTCGALVGNCWCMDVKLSDEIREDLKTKFKDCLCPKCLEKNRSESRVYAAKPPRFAGEKAA